MAEGEVGWLWGRLKFGLQREVSIFALNTEILALQRPATRNLPNLAGDNERGHD